MTPKTKGQGYARNRDLDRVAQALRVSQMGLTQGARRKSFYGGSTLVVPPVPRTARQLAAAAVESALTLTTQPPPGWAPPPEETTAPRRVWLTWGVVNGVLVTNIDDPIEIALETTDTVVYVAIKATLSDFHALAVTEAEVVTATDIEELDTPPFGVEEPTTPEEAVALPAYTHILMGRIVIIDGSVTLQNTGSGSLVIHAYVSGLALSDVGLGNASWTRQLAYSRTDGLAIGNFADLIEL